MIGLLLSNPTILGKALDFPKVWIRCKEYIIDPVTQEKADLIFQNKYNAYRAELDTVCFVVELKSDQADHEVVGQLQKAVDLMAKTGPRIGHWYDTKGIAIAKQYTASGLRLLHNAGFRAFLWGESEESGVFLRELSSKKRKKKSFAVT